jgi:hypothetical protein
MVIREFESSLLLRSYSSLDPNGTRGKAAAKKIVDLFSWHLEFDKYPMILGGFSLDYSKLFFTPWYVKESYS